jgi:hypothetical protein
MKFNNYIGVSLVVGGLFLGIGGCVPAPTPPKPLEVHAIDEKIDGADLDSLCSQRKWKGHFVADYIGGGETALSSADVDGDGDIDVYATVLYRDDRGNTKVALCWYENPMIKR